MNEQTLGIERELVTVVAEQLDELRRQWRVPAVSEVVIMERCPARGARRETEATTAVSAVELGEAAAATFELGRDERVDRSDDDRVVPLLYLGLGVVVDELVPWSAEAK